MTNDERINYLRKVASQASESAKKEIANFYSGKSKSEIKENLKDGDHNTLNYIFEVGLSYEIYNACAAVKEIFHERKIGNSIQV